MSSFRPDPRPALLSFVPSSREGRPFFSATPENVEASVEASEVEADPPTGRMRTDEEIAALEQAAFDRGVASQAPVRARFDHACEVLNASALGLEERTEALRVGAPREIAALALVVAQRWVGEQFAADPARFEATLEAALDICREQGPRQLFLSAADLQTIERENPEAFSDWKQSARLEVIAEEGLLAGEFRIEADRGLVDGRFETVAHRLSEALASEASAGDPSLSEAPSPEAVEAAEVLEDLDAEPSGEDDES